MAARLRATGRYPNAERLSPRALVYWTRLEAAEANRKLANAALAARLSRAEKDPFTKAIAALTGE